MPPADRPPRVSPVDYPLRVMKLEFALDDKLFEGVTGTFVLPTTNVTFEGEAVPYGQDDPPLHPFVIKFPVVLRKLNLQDAFFNGLPAEWKETEWKT